MERYSSDSAAIASGAFVSRDVTLRDGAVAALRSLAASDAESFVALERAVVDDGRGVPQLPGQSFAKHDHLASIWERHGGRELFIGAWLDGVLMAQGNLRRERLARVAHVAELGVSVHPDRQGIGLGRAVTESLLEWARAQESDPLYRIELRVFASNERAIRLYESLGFLHEGRRRDYLRVDDSTFEDDLIMGLLL